MPDPIILPDPAVPLMLGNRMHPDWYRLFRLFADSYNTSNASQTAALSALETQVDALDKLTTRGDLLTRDASGHVRFGIGTNGQVLSNNGTDLVWSTTAAPVVAVEAGAVAAAATLDIAVGSTYDLYEIDLINMIPVTVNVAPWIRFSQSGSFLSGGSDYLWGITGPGNDESDSEITLSGNVGNNADEGINVTVRVFRPGVSAIQKTCTWFGVYRTSVPVTTGVVGGGRLLANTNAIDGVRFLFSSGNIASGYYAVRGIRFT